MIKSCQIAYALRNKYITRHIVIHDKDRILADYNQSSFEMAKNDIKQFVMQNCSASCAISDYTLPKVTTQI